MRQTTECKALGLSTCTYRVTPCTYQDETAAMFDILAQSTKSGSGVTKRHCNNVATDEKTDHVHPEPIEWHEDSVYNRDDSSQANDLERLNDQSEQVQEQERVGTDMQQ